MKKPSPRLVLLALLAAAGFTVSRASAITPTFTGMPRGANDMSPCDYFDPSGCEDKAVFNTASFDRGTNRWVYASAQNSRILVNTRSLPGGTWASFPSPYAINMDSIDPDSTVALGSVFYQSPGVYTSSHYTHVMYFVFQGASTPGLAGAVCVAYSNDGVIWTTPIWAVYAGSGATRGRICGIMPAGNVPAEAISGFQTDSTHIHLFHLEGDVSIVSAQATSGRTLTYYSTSTAADPDVLTRVGELTSAGMSNLNRPGGTAHRFFINLDATYDPANGRIYLLRVYGAPYDVSDPTIPCQSVCPGGITTFPMRAQIYDMLVNGNFTQTLTTSMNVWNLLGDLGDFYGHQTFDTGTCKPYKFASCVLSSRYLPDADSLTVHKLPTGLLYRNGSGQAHLFAGLWANKPREQSCHDSWLVGGSAGGTWRDGELYEFDWPPTGTDPLICP